MIRVTPGIHAETHEFIATAHEDQKFGLSMASEDGESPALHAISGCVAHPDIELMGLHCHIGSQIFAADGFAQAADRGPPERVPGGAASPERAGAPADVRARHSRSPLLSVKY